jgi:hypothetical protein
MEEQHGLPFVTRRVLSAAPSTKIRAAESAAGIQEAGRTDPRTNWANAPQRGGGATQEDWPVAVTSWTTAAILVSLLLFVGAWSIAREPLLRTP